MYVPLVMLCETLRDTVLSLPMNGMQALASSSSLLEHEYPLCKHSSRCQVRACERRNLDVGTWCVEDYKFLGKRCCGVGWCLGDRQHMYVCVCVCMHGARESPFILPPIPRRAAFVDRRSIDTSVA
jgi:hypothetical protein